MKYDKVEDEAYPHRLELSGDEVAATRAAFRESTHELAKNGKSASISKFAIWVAGWQDDVTEIKLMLANTASVTDRLREFKANTDRAIKEIPEITGIPPFDSDDVAKRINLGQKAFDLANQINGAAEAEGTGEGLAAEFAEFLEGREGPA